MATTVDLDRQIGEMFRVWLQQWGCWVSTTENPAPICFFCKATIVEPHFDDCVYIRANELIRDAQAMQAQKESDGD